MITKEKYKEYRKLINKNHLQYRTIKEWEIIKARYEDLKEKVKNNFFPKLEEGYPCYCLGDGIYVEEKEYEKIFHHRVQQEIFFILINDEFTQGVLDHIYDLLDKGFYEDLETYSDDLLDESEVYYTTYQGE